DFNLPERFKLEYVDEDGSKKRPVMIHRAIYGSLDRMIAILLEHFRGRLPAWLSPVQVRILPISEENQEYANKILVMLRENGIRGELDPSGETLSKRIKRAYDEGVPYLVIVGRKEALEEKVTIRSRGNVEVKGVPLKDFIEKINLEVRNRETESLIARGSR
ncbi:MAG: His/Gly/Thr/Pro-type tRNA ligase C-terminal domain-containing protein, partial [Metallosphaera sp.]